MSKKDTNQFASIIAARKQEEVPADTAAIPTDKSDKKERSGKRGNPDYSAVTVYIPTEIYTFAQFKMARQGRKREMSELFTELLQEWLERQK